MDWKTIVTALIITIILLKIVYNTTQQFHEEQIRKEKLEELTEGLEIIDSNQT